MAHTFYIQPDLEVLNKYGYISAPAESLAKAILLNHGEKVELETLPRSESREELVERYLDLVEKYELKEYTNTLFYIILREYEKTTSATNHIELTYHSKLRAREMARLLLCFQESKVEEIEGLKLTTCKESVKLTDKKLIRWIGKVISSSFERGKFTYQELGEDVWTATQPGTNGYTFTEPVNYTRLHEVSKRPVKSPKVLIKKLLAASLHRIWRFIDQETSLTTTAETTYSDRQMNFLFEVGELLGWLSNDEIDSPAKDYMYALFANLTKINRL